MIHPFRIAIVSLIALVAQALPAEEAKPVAAATAVVIPEGRDKAIAFLERVEKKNADTKGLQAEFTQVRQDQLFQDEVKSKGRFWYQAPDKFHASYEDKNSSEIWMVDGKIYNYIPNLKQVEVYKQVTGEKAPINQMLLGFGVKVKEIEELFAVSLGKEAGKGEIAVAFDSKDLERSLQFSRITIIFDEDKVEPKKIFLVNSESEITVELKGVKFNPSIKESVFKATWPNDADVVDYSSTN